MLGFADRVVHTCILRDQVQGEIGAFPGFEPGKLKTVQISEGVDVYRLVLFHDLLHDGFGHGIRIGFPGDRLHWFFGNRIIIRGQFPVFFGVGAGGRKQESE